VLKIQTIQPGASLDITLFLAGQGKTKISEEENFGI